MTRTCADCKYHKCNNNCMTIRRCNGYCTYKTEHKKCSAGRCFNYIKDDYFRLKEEVNI